MTENETWKDVVGFEGLYKVSDKGRVYSVERMSSQCRRYGGRMLKPKYGGKGYPQVSLHKNGISKTKSVHQLVAEAFIPNPKGFLEVNHKDENKSNNELSNLEWCTREYNVNYGTRSERSSKALSKKVKATNIKTGEVVTFNSLTEVGRKGYNTSAVSKVCWGTYKTRHGKLVGGDGRTYKGFRWSYKVAEGNEGE